MANVFIGWLRKFLHFDKYEYESISIDLGVIEEIVDFARENHPREFIMFLEGTVKNKVLRVFGLAYQEYVANENSALAKIDFPLATNIVGSVHSHPGPSNKPSRADLYLFSKQGMLHLIIKQPYRSEDIAAYDFKGRPLVFKTSER